MFGASSSARAAAVAAATTKKATITKKAASNQNKNAKYKRKLIAVITIGLHKRSAKAFLISIFLLLYLCHKWSTQPLLSHDIGGPSPPLIIVAASNYHHHHQQLLKKSKNTNNSNNNNKRRKIPRTLVVVIGNLRGGEASWQTLVDQLLLPNEADLALVIGATTATTTNHTSSSLYDRAKYLYEFPEFTDWADAVDLIPSNNNASSASWRTSILPHVRPDKEWSSFMGPIEGISGSGVIHFMARYYVQQLILEQTLLSKYDRFVITRSDHYYECRHDLGLLDNRFVWVPTEEDYKGICDRHVVCNSSMVMNVLNVLPSLIQTPELYAPLSQLKEDNPERFLWRAWRVTGVAPAVRRFHRTMFTLKQENIDGTRGRSESSHNVGDQSLTRLGLWVKYPHEYYAAHCTCRGKPLRNHYQSLFYPSDRVCFRDTALNRGWLPYRKLPRIAHSTKESHS